MRWAGDRSATWVVGLGFFALVAQTLLFRDFLTVYEGSEFGLASFFSSWLLWVAMGALLGRMTQRLVRAGAPGFAWLGLLYAPAFLLQHALISHSRILAGVAPYELFPFWKMFPVALLANAPASLVTGFLFALACGWLGGRLTAARVYSLEATGSMLGGLATTLALAAGWSAEHTILAALLVLVAAVGWALPSRRGKGAAIALAAVVVGVMLLGGAARWEQAHHLNAWRRLLPAEGFQGSFSTPQARYLFGEYRNQFNVLAWETVTESLPDTEHASEMAAVTLAQAPGARRVLVIGPGSLALCQSLLSLPNLHVTYLHPDPDYPAQVLAQLHEAMKAGLSRLACPAMDVRRYVQSANEPFDLIILNLPNPAALVMNRYFTLEFFQQLKARLSEKGVVSIRFAGAENYLGPENIHLGATLFYTLGKVFPHLALKPGDESWWAAATTDVLAQEAETLRDRWTSIPEATRLYPAAGLLSLYPADRVRFQMEAYHGAVQAQPDDYFLNTDQHPKASLYSLLLAGKQAGRTTILSKGLLYLSHTSLWALPLALVAAAFLRRLYLGHRRSRPDVSPALYDLAMLLMVVGWVGLSLNLTLMFLFESMEGSLFLYEGFISALFMLGLVLGSRMAHVIHTHARRSRALLAILLGALILFLLALIAGFDSLTAGLVMGLFVPAGWLCGAVVPPVVSLLRGEDEVSPPNEASPAEIRTGAFVEHFDNLGGVLGGLLTGLVLLPVFGITATWTILIALVLLALPALAKPRAALQTASLFDRFAGMAGHVCLGLLILTLLLIHFHRPPMEDGVALFQKIAEQMVPGRELRPKACPSKSGGPPIRYFEVNEGGGTNSWIYRSEDFAPGISGYGGPISAAVWVDGQGHLKELAFLQVNETPAYLRMVEPWMNRLKGLDLFSSASTPPVDGVTGATVTSQSILLLLSRSGRQFAEQALGMKATASLASAAQSPTEWGVWVLGALLLTALLLRRRPSPWRRRIFLLVVLLLTGIWLNLQYSMSQVLDLLGGRLPEWSWTAAALLLVGVPLLVIASGNVYCGWLCPFGALQECLHDLTRFRWIPPKSLWRIARTFKFVLLFSLLAAGLMWDGSVEETDPLVTVFQEFPSHLLTVIGLTLLGLSLVYRRFWCRNLCPAGAFLALLSRLTPWRRRRHPARCDLGVCYAEELDCLQCDRCRMKGPLTAAKESPLLGVALLVVAVAMAVMLIWPVVTSSKLTPVTASTSSRVRPSGMVRPVNQERLEQLISERRLSDQEARYYHPLPDGVDAP